VEGVKPMPRLALAAIDVWQRQIPQSGTIAWWQGTQALCSQTQDPDTQHWVLTISALGLLASTNRKDTAHRTQTGYHQATQQAHARFLAHSFTHTETLAQQQQWIDWAIWMCASSSALPLLSKDAMAIISSPSFSSASRNKP